MSTDFTPHDPQRVIDAPFPERGHEWAWKEVTALLFARARAAGKEGEKAVMSVFILINIRRYFVSKCENVWIRSNLVTIASFLK